MASFAEILALQGMSGGWGCDLIDDATEYLPPAGYAIKQIVVLSDAIIASARQWEDKTEVTLTSSIKGWIGPSLPGQTLITTHDRHPLSRIQLTSGAVMVYFCKSPV